MPRWIRLEALIVLGKMAALVPLETLILSQLAGRGKLFARKIYHFGSRSVIPVLPV